jgi:hypothetical protein
MTNLGGYGWPDLQPGRLEPIMSRVARAAASLVAALFVVACTNGSPSAATTSFASKTYGYSLTVPAGWTVVQASAAWDGNGAPGHDIPQADQFVGPAASSAWAYAAPTTKDLAGYVKERIAANAADHAATCPATPEAEDRIDVGGEPGTLVAWNCGILINGAFAVHNGTGYLFGFRDPAVHASADVADRVAFLELLHSVKFPR